MREPVIGLEIHLAVASRSKLFCGCDADGFGRPPNTHVCPVCMGLPGTLPVANLEAVHLAVRFALALGCTVPATTQFHRKHYVYPDAPKNYQISQFDRPIGELGRLRIPEGREIAVARCHLEEDAGRLVHPPYAPYSLLDLNRAGAPLIEMVTEPVITSPEEARAFLHEVQAVARAVGASDASPEEGKMRADVNVSLRNDDGTLGTKVEVKNLNSFRSVEAALHFEVKRQSRLLDEGFEIAQETRGWNEGGQKTVPQRGKEMAADYRYMPDPDLPVLHLEADLVDRWRAELPMLPARKQALYEADGVAADAAHQIAYDVRAGRLFEATRAAWSGPASMIAAWLTSEVAGALRARDVDPTTLSPESSDFARRFADLLRLVHEGTISATVGKDLLVDVIGGADAVTLVDERGLAKVSDEGALAAVVDDVMRSLPDVVASARVTPKAVNALLGRVMKETGGTADAAVVRRLIQERL